MTNLNLLYVEDDEEIIEDIDFFLKRHFNEIIIAQDGEEAFRYFEEKNPDIIILDINIPKLNGLKFWFKQDHSPTTMGFRLSLVVHPIL